MVSSLLSHEDAVCLHSGGGASAIDVRWSDRREDAAEDERSSGYKWTGRLLYLDFFLYVRCLYQPGLGCSPTIPTHLESFPKTKTT
jgi:hypothetical protein